MNRANDGRIVTVAYEVTDLVDQDDGGGQHTRCHNHHTTER